MKRFFSKIYNKTVKVFRSEKTEKNLAFEQRRFEKLYRKMCRKSYLHDSRKLDDIMDEYVDFVLEYKNIIRDLYEFRKINSPSSKLKRLIFNSGVFNYNFEYYYLTPNKVETLQRIKCWLARVEKIQVGYGSTWKLIQIKLEKRLDQLLDMVIKQERQARIVGEEIKGKIEEFCKFLFDTLKTKVQDIFKFAQQFNKSLMDLFGEGLAVCNPDLFQIILENASKLYVVEKKNSNILNLLIWQKAADKVLMKMCQIKGIDANIFLESIKKISDLVRIQQESEAKNGVPDVNMKSEEIQKKLFIKNCIDLEKAELEFYSSYCQEEEEQKQLRKLLDNLFVTLKNIKVFVCLLYLNRVNDEKSSLYLQLKDNISRLVALNVTTESFTSEIDNTLEEILIYLSNLLEVEPRATSSWDNKVYSHIKRLKEIVQIIRKCEIQ